MVPTISDMSFKFSYCGMYIAVLNARGLSSTYCVFLYFHEATKMRLNPQTYQPLTPQLDARMPPDTEQARLPFPSQCVGLVSQLIETFSCWILHT